MAGSLYVVESAASRWNSQRDRLIADWSRTDKQKKRLEKELKKIDSYLEVHYIDSEVAKLPPAQRAVGVVPARWHIVRRNPKGIDAWFPIMGPNGEYAEPSLQVAEDMKKADLWRSGAMLEMRQRQEREAKEKANKEVREREQRSDEVVHAYRAAKRVRGDGGMTRRTDLKRDKPKKLILPGDDTA